MTDTQNLYALDKAGKLRIYMCSYEGGKIETKTGTLNGKLVSKVRNIIEGKAGRTLEEQVTLKIMSLRKEKEDEGYKDVSTLIERAESLSIDLPPLYGKEDLDKEKEVVQFLYKQLNITYNTNSYWRPLPMLAEKYKEKRDKVKFPKIAQPKLNGVRCLAEYDSDLQEVVFSSRGGQQFNVPHLKAQLLPFFLMNQNLKLDGELYKHGIPLQIINGEVSKSNGCADWIEYHVYDNLSDLPQDRRLADNRIFITIMKNQFGVTHVEQVLSKLVYSHEEIKEVHDELVAKGYEGAILREPTAKYMISFRDECLLKVKEFEEEEFEIVSCMSDPLEIGSSFVFILRNNIDDQLFEARPTGTVTQKEHWYKHIGDVVGKKATLRFQERTVGGLPSQGHVRHDKSKCLVEAIREIGT